MTEALITESDPIVQPRYDNGVQMAYPGEGPNTRGFGLSKRELFAAMALQGLLSQSPGDEGQWIVPAAVHLAVRYADELLATLEKAT